MRYAIIGAGPAGVVAAETLRAADPDGVITLYAGEGEPPYSRMAIPYLLVGKIDESGTYLRRSPDHFARQRIDVVQATVTAIDTRSKSLAVAGKGEMPYDSLLLATGSRPATPPIPGIDHERVVSCWTLADARKIAAHTDKGSRVVLMGAGFIGCIILEALAQRGVNLTVVEMADRMVARMLDDKAGGLLQQWCEQQGVRVLTGTKVTAIEPGNSNAPIHVQLDSHETLPADLVISATGVLPNAELAKDAGINVNRGIVVDHHLQTSVPGVYAVGDVAETDTFGQAGKSVLAIQPTAVEQARAAALSMSGSPSAFVGALPMNVLDTLGLISVSFGAWAGVPGGDSAQLYDPAGFRYINLQFDGEKLVGATGVGHTDHVGAIRGLIQGQTPLGHWKQRLSDDPLQLMEAFVALAQNIR